MQKFLSTFILIGILNSTAAQNYDVVIYGGTPAAVTAAIQVQKMGKSVVDNTDAKLIGN